MSEISFRDRVVIITGAGGGLGKDYALEISRRGGAVVVNDIGVNVHGLHGSPRMADNVVSEIKAAGGRAVANYDSVTTRPGAQAIVQAGIDAFGKIDAVISNAGTLRNDWFEEFSEEDRDAMFLVHLTGTFNIAQAAFPHMKKQGYGRILFVSSAAGMFGNKTQAAYGAAKAGIFGLMNVVSQEGLPYNILCNALLPAAATRMGDKMDEKITAEIEQHCSGFGTAMTPDFVTPLAVYLVSEACNTSHSAYSALGGRYARVFVGMTEGWLGPRAKPALVEDIAQHIDHIRNAGATIIPASLPDEFRILAEQVEIQAKS